MSGWFAYAIGAALLYGLHQVFTKLASERISDGLGAFVVEASAQVASHSAVSARRPERLLGIVLALIGLYLVR